MSLINYYGPKILRDAGFATGTREGLMLSMIFLMVFNVIGNLACVVLSKRYGRRQMILFSAIPISASLIVLDLNIIFSSLNGHYEGKSFI